MSEGFGKLRISGRARMMSRGAKAVLIHGIINALLPIILLLIRIGVFGDVSYGMTWGTLFVIGLLLIIVPIVSSVIGIVTASVQLKKTSEGAVKVGLFLSIVGFVLQIAFRLC